MMRTFLPSVQPAPPARFSWNSASTALPRPTSSGVGVPSCTVCVLPRPGVLPLMSQPGARMTPMKLMTPSTAWAGTGASTEIRLRSQERGDETAFHVVFPLKLGLPAAIETAPGARRTGSLRVRKAAIFLGIHVRPDAANAVISRRFVPVGRMLESVRAGEYEHFMGQGREI